jgi:hypothetical protein
VLEACLNVIASASQEVEATSSLAGLEAVYQSLRIDLQRLEQEQAVACQVDARAEKLLRSTPLEEKSQGEPVAQDRAALHKDTLLHLPYTHSSVCCLLVQAGDQHLLIPFHQIQRISNKQREQIDVCYSLQELLAFPGVSPVGVVPCADPACRHLLILSSEDAAMEGGTAGIVVDEILGEQECVVKPLVFYLQRPGIAGATIDGKGRVLLMVDLLALIRAAPQCANYSDTPPSLWLEGVSE